MERDKINQIASEFSDTNSIQMIEDRLVKNYPYLDKFDMNEIIIAILNNQNKSTIESKREELERLKNEIDKIQQLFKGTNYADFIPFVVSVISSVTTVGSVFYIYNNFYNNKTIADTIFAISSLIFLISTISCAIDYKDIGSVKDYNERRKQLKLELEQQGLTIKDLKKQLKQLKIEYEIMSKEVKEHELQCEMHEKINNIVDSSVEEEKTEVGKEKLLCR